MRGPLYIALLHHPVLDREGRVITSAVTNADIHDIARSARTYGVKRYFIVTPIAEQADLVRTIIGHWTCGAGGTLNPSRREALEAVEVAGTLADVVEAIAREESGPVNTVVT
ncbi:MAG: RNA methyltransferase, partial [Syntrophaceae bacterium]